MDSKLSFLCILLIVILCFALSKGGRGGSCPQECFCHDVNNIIYCARTGLRRIPDEIPPSSVQLNLNGNIMDSSIIERRNLSRFVNLEHLYLSECGIERIEVGAFRDLQNLEWLDLSSNRIRVIEDYTFQGLSLNQLFLNGNRNIRIQDNAFADFALSGLRIYECSLTKLDFNVFQPLMGSLTNLWLNDNELDKVDRRFLPLFSSLTHLRLGSNPLHCNCEVQWLKEFYDKNSVLFDSPDEGVPSCLSPTHLKGKQFNQISLFDFQCQPPSFRNVDAVIKGETGMLRCTASGDPAPMLYWIQPSGRSHLYKPPASDSVKYNEAVLNISSETTLRNELSGSYFCFAINEAGNMTLTFNLTWPTSAPREPIIKMVPGTESGIGSGHSTFPLFNNGKTTPSVLSTTSTSVEHKQDNWGGAEVSISNTNDAGSDNKKNNSKNLQFTVDKMHSSHLYTLAELLGAIFGTFACTLLLCCIIIPLYFRSRWKNNNPPHHNLTGNKPTFSQETMYLNGSGSHTGPPQLPPRPPGHAYHYFDSVSRMSKR